MHGRVLEWIYAYIWHSMYVCIWRLCIYAYGMVCVYAYGIRSYVTFVPGHLTNLAFGGTALQLILLCMWCRWGWFSPPPTSRWGRLSLIRLSKPCQLQVRSLVRLTDRWVVIVACSRDCRRRVSIPFASFKDLHWMKWILIIMHTTTQIWNTVNYYNFKLQ